MQILKFKDLHSLHLSKQEAGGKASGKAGCSVQTASVWKSLLDFLRRFNMLLYCFWLQSCLWTQLQYKGPISYTILCVFVHHLSQQEFTESTSLVGTDRKRSKSSTEFEVV